MSRAGGPFLSLVAAAVAARLLMVLFFPPLLDVYYYDTQAVHALLGGLDPYGYGYTGVPSWLATPEASNVFAYLPGVALFLAPFGAVSDIRLGLVAADLLVAWGIYSIGGPRARLASLVFLLLPATVLFSTSYPNNTLVSMAFLGLAVALRLRGRGRPGSVMLGGALASSQFVWLLFPLFLVWSLKSKRAVEAAIAVATGVAVSLPFLIWNWSSLAYDTLVFEFTRAPRSVLSPAAFGVNVNPTLDGIAVTLLGATVPLAIRVLLTLGALGLAAYGCDDLSSVLSRGTWFMVFTIFVLPNDLSWWYLELPFQTFLMWAALEARRSLGPPVNA